MPTMNPSPVLYLARRFARAPRHARLALHHPRGIAATAGPLTSMSSHPPPAPGDDFHVAMIGAGNIMFGSDEGPWNHSFRFEHKLGPRLKVVALIDPAHDRALAVLEGKRASFVESAYRDTKIYPSVQAFHDDMPKELEPKAIVIGSPPAFRGGVRKPKDLELQLLKLFPNSAYFVEKVRRAVSRVALDANVPPQLCSPSRPAPFTRLTRSRKRLSTQATLSRSVTCSATCAACKR